MNITSIGNLSHKLSSITTFKMNIGIGDCDSDSDTYMVDFVIDFF